jgi:hypothetical protein
MSVPEHRVVYKILVSWAKAKPGKVGFYAMLSDEYERITGVRLSAHLTWDDPLGAINNIVARWGAPAISVLVITRNSNEPGGGFWGCAENVPACPKTTMKRVEVLNEIRNAVFAYDWPATLDGPAKG